MAVNVFANITKKGVITNFRQGMASVPLVYPKHCMEVESNAGSETYVWAGTLPQPRLFLNGRTFAGMRDFTFILRNERHELSFIVDRDSWADDQWGQIASRIREIGQVFEMYKDYLCVTMVNLATAGTQLGWDGTAYYSATRTVGASANVYNIATAAAAAAIPTVAELTPVLVAMLNGNGTCTGIANVQDDQGRPMAALAVTQRRVLVHPMYEKPMKEILNSILISSSSNPYMMNWCEVDVSPYMTLPTTSHGYFILDAVGAERKPWIFQRREALEIEVYNDSKDVALNNGVMVLATERFRFGAGEMRYSAMGDMT